MTLLALGISHRTARVQQREKASLAGGRACTLLKALAADPVVREAVALSTCNRTEVYAVAQSEKAGHAAVAEALVASTRISRPEVDEVGYALTGAEVRRHLLRVAASLDSMVIGESEIQGQVRDALALAEGHRVVGPRLRELFRHALIVGKRVRRKTAVGRGAVSVSSVAVDLARETSAQLTGRRALLIGAGRVAESTARALLGSGLRTLTVANRSLLAAEELAEQFGGVGVPLDGLDDELSRADIVICSTDSPRPILSADAVRRAITSRGDEPLVLIDIAVPRDVEAAARHLPGVVLRNIDDLERVVQKNLNGRLEEARRAELIVAEELRRSRQPRGRSFTAQVSFVARNVPTTSLLRDTKA